MANMTFGTNILPKSNANVTIGNSDNPWTIVSPELTGTPTAPTATQGDSSTAIATTAFVAGEISDKVSDKADKTDTVLNTTLSRGRKANTTVGTGSFAFGYDVEASGSYSYAEGLDTVASNNESHAEGAGTTASGGQAHAEGAGTTASNSQAHAEGAGTTASGQHSHAEGGSTVASGVGSHAEGANTNATGPYSHTEGYNSTASGNYSHAEGSNSTAAGNLSHAEGDTTTATGGYSHAEGYGGTYTVSGTTYTPQAKGPADHTEGYQCLTDSNQYTTPGNHAEGFQTRATGGAAHAEGNGTLASGSYSHAEGSGTTASGSMSHTEGGGTVASGQYSHAEGNGTRATQTAAHSEGTGTIASGVVSHAEGSATTASGEVSHAEGVGTTASGSKSHAEGNTSHATGDAAHAEGTVTTASGQGAHAEGQGGSTFTQPDGITYTSGAKGVADHTEGFNCATETAMPGNHAEGYNTVSKGGASHSEGQMTLASGTVAHAEGYATTASGMHSHAEGCNVVSKRWSSHASGKYNVPDDFALWEEWTANTLYHVGDCRKVTSQSGVNGYRCKNEHTSGSSFSNSNWTVISEGLFAEIIGNGTTNALSNARALTWDGDERLAGDVYVNCNADSTGGTKVATVTDISAKVDASEKGAANGVAELDANGKVPSSQLPSYVDDIVEGYYYEGHFYEDSTHQTEITGETGKVYVDVSANTTYRWSGSAFVGIGGDLTLGETSSTAYRGDRGADAYAHAVTNKGSAFSSGLYKITTNSEGHVTGATSVAKADITALGIPGEDTTYENKQAASGGTDLSLVTTGEKYAWNSKYVKPANGIPATDLESGVIPDVSGKADKVSSATEGNIAKLDSNGNLADSGFTLGVSVPSDAVFTDTTYSAATQSADGLMSSTDKTKLDGVAAGATANEGTITGVTMNGSSMGTSGVVDLGTVITSHQDISGKADKVTGATSGDIATLDGNGNLVDSGYTIATSVPENAVFTDTTYSAGAGLSLSSGTFSVTGMDTSSGSTSKCLTEKGTWAEFTNNAGTVTGVKINGTTKSPSSGVVDLGTVITDVSGKADNSAVVHIGGSLETITGQKKFENSVRIANGSTSPSLFFHGKDLSSANGCIYLNASETSEQKYGQCYFYFRHYSPNADGTRSDYYENFKLPAVDIGRDSTTGNGAYNILTTKSAVTVPQGGTGATTASGALANLGAVDKSGDTMTGNLIIQQSSGSPYVAAKNTTSGLQADVRVGSSGTNHGIYSNGYVDSNSVFHSSAKWLIYRDEDNNTIVNGSATDNILKTDIADNLTTDDATKVLSAKQGKSLYDTTVKLTGNQNISGAKTFDGYVYVRDNSNNPFVGFRGKGNTVTSASIYALSAGNGEGLFGRPYFQFREYSPLSNGSGTAGGYDSFSLPRVASGQTETNSYDILTTKDYPFDRKTGSSPGGTTSGDGTNKITFTAPEAARQCIILFADKMTSLYCASLTGSTVYSGDLPSGWALTKSDATYTLTRTATQSFKYTILWI